MGDFDMQIQCEEFWCDEREWEYLQELLNGEEHHHEPIIGRFN